MMLWSPSPQRIKEANVTRYLSTLSKQVASAPKDFIELYDWSVKEPAAFWQSVWDFSEIKSSAKSSCVYEAGHDFKSGTWFKGAKLNFAENLLSRNDDKTAIVFCCEDKVRTSLSYKDLYTKVGQLSAVFKDLGVKVGDRIAGVLPNCPEAIIAMLAASSLGAVWSSCSPDFGVSGILDRFGQIEPTVLLYCDFYWHKGTRLEVSPKINELRKALPSTKNYIMVRGAGNDSSLPAFGHEFETVLKTKIDATLSFAQLPFNHPLYIMFSSGTTGKPKCIVHGQGGTLLEHRKEHLLHVDLKSSDNFFYQTTTGWMMWNWLVSGLAQGCTLVLYDGAPFINDGRIIFELAERENISILGTNAKFIAALEKAGVKPKSEFKLSNLKTILSTGSPLLPESFDYVYRDIKDDVLLSSISGGTDILGCFALGSPTLPVYRSELQTRSLGMAVEVYSEQGKPLQSEKGELVCTKPFPSMPIYFFGDESGDKYESAYFKRFSNVWCHGDWVELSEHGGMIFLGRSDTVLNPGGIRIGTSEIYRQVEKLEQVEESIVIGQEWQGDVRVVLFVKLKNNFQLTQELADEIRALIRKETSPFHVPKKIIAVSDIPRTRSGKISELAVKDIVHGIEPKNVEALLNPEALNLFRNIEDLNR